MKAAHGFVRRVMLVGLMSATLGSLVAAAVAISVVDWLLRTQGDHRLMGAAIELAGELDEEPPDRRLDQLVKEIRDENQELAPSGIRLAVFAGKNRIAGEGSDHTPDVGDCETQKLLGVRVRSCSIRYGDWALVATAHTDTPQLGWLYLLALLGACAVGALAGGVFGQRGARWAIAPLRTMTEQLRTIVPGRDITLGEPGDCREIEAVRKGIEDLLERIRTLLAQAERFAADAAHELRSPMASLSVQLELLAETLTGTDQDSVLLAHARVLELSTLVERLLISALPTEQLRQGFEAVALEDVVLDVIGKGVPEVQSRTTFQQGTEGLVFGDLQLLTSLVQNAVDNAIRHGEGTVLIQLTEVDQEVHLEVKDDGPGIHAAYRERVFEPFFRVPGNQSEGHGLGLALIGHVARAHGGTARFEECEQGAKLVVSLPMWSQNAEPYLERES